MGFRQPLFLLAVLITALPAAACSRPIDITTEGDFLSIGGARDCTQTTDTACSLDIAQDVIASAEGEVVLPLVAIDTRAKADVTASRQVLEERQPDVMTGFDSLFIGHSFFKPFAEGMPFHAANAGLTDHTQELVFNGGEKGAPEALWNNRSKRADIQAVLDDGDVELFGMTYHPAYPALTGYQLWFDYALERNPDTRFFVALPWLTGPASYTAEQYSTTWHESHDGLWHGFLDDLRVEYPGVDIYGIPYGQAAVELYKLYDAGQLPDVDSLISGSGDAIFRDQLGHADEILVELGRLVWLRAIYRVDLSSYAYDPGYTVDLLTLADSIMDEHDPAYNAP
jgi:hypothetical protein